MKKVSSLVLVMLMAFQFTLAYGCIASISSSAYASDTIIDSGTADYGFKWTLDDEGTLTIEGTTWPPGASTWKDQHKDDIVNVVIKDGITNIYSRAFFQCTNLESVSIPNSVTKFSNEVFSGCSKLSKVVIPASVSEMYNGTFEGCDMLKTAGPIGSGCDIEFGWTTKIPSFAFYGSCLTNVTIPDGITSIGNNVFYNCSSLSSVVMPASVANIGNSVFQSCTELKSAGPIGTGCDYEFAWTDVIPKNAFPNSLDMIIYPDTITECAVISNDHLTVHCGEDTYAYNAYVNDEKVNISLHDDEIITIKEADCVNDGLQKAECSICGRVTPEEVVPALGHDFSNEWTIDVEATEDVAGSKSHHCSRCEEKADVTEIPRLDVIRIYGNTRYDTAIASADKLLELQGKDKFDNIIVACGSNFPDALTGSYLAKVKEAPIILVDSKTEAKIADYIKTKISDEGTVYILGGTGAVSGSFAEKIKALNVERLAGASRYSTNIEILKAAEVKAEDILICTGTGYADSLSASAAGKPMLLVGKTITDEQKEFLATLETEKAYVIGGTGAVSDNIAKEYSALTGITPKRIAGASRYTTSVKVAETFFGSSCSKVALAYAKNFPDGLAGGPVAMAMNAPLVLVANDSFSNAKTYCISAGVRNVYVFGGAGLISDKVAKTMIG